MIITLSSAPSDLVNLVNPVPALFRFILSRDLLVFFSSANPSLSSRLLDNLVGQITG